MYKYNLKIPGIFCGNCATPVENALYSCKNEITSQEMEVKADITGQCATVKLKNIILTEPEVRKKLTEALDDIGYPAEEPIIVETPTVSATTPLVDQTTNNNRRKAIRKFILKGIAGIVSGAILMGLCLSGIMLPLVAQGLLAAFSIGLTIYLGKDIFRKAAINIRNVIKGREKSLSMNVLISISSVIALCISSCSLFFPWLPMTFDTALLILGFSLLGTALKASESARTDRKLKFKAAKSPFVHRLEPDANTKATRAEIKPGQLIRVYAGQTIPLDGYCRNPCAHVCKINDTGKNKPCPVKKGDYLEAGWEVPQGVNYIDIQVDKDEAHSTIAHLNNKYEQALAEKIKKRKKPPFVRLADLMANYFVPCILAISLISAVAIGVLFSPMSALQAISSMLASACPCTLGLIIPFAIKTAIIKTAADGLRVKSEESFQFLSEVDTVIFDWNGTLTTGDPQVVHTNLKGEQLDYLAALEGQSNHPFAAAIYAHIKKKKTALKSLSVSELEPNHSGLQAKIEQERYLTGNKKYLSDLGINVEAYDQLHHLKRQKKRYQAQYVTYFARQNAEGKYEIQGHILLQDPLRPDAAQVVRKLKQQGIKVGIWSGSDDESLSAFAKKHKVDYFQMNCLGTSKKRGDISKEDLMAKLCRQGRKTVMVGDSANDAFAMLKSDFAIAIKSKNAHEMTEQSADAVLDPKASPDPAKPLHSILNVILRSKSTMRSIKTNMALNMIYNLLSSSLFTLGLVVLGFAINPAIGAALMVLQSALLFWNLKRMIPAKPTYANDARMPPPQENIYKYKLIYKPDLEPKVQPPVSPIQKTRTCHSRESGNLRMHSSADSRFRGNDRRRGNDKRAGTESVMPAIKPPQTSQTGARPCPI